MEKFLNFINDNLPLILEIAKVLAGALVTTIPMIIAFVKAAKNKKAAKTAAEVAAAEEVLRTNALDFIKVAEVTYKSVDEIMKQRGNSAGAVKKDSVMTKLQALAIDKGFKFDTEFWSKEIDTLVALTKNVNK